MGYLDLLNRTCTIYRLSGIDDYDYSTSDEGEVTESWNSVSSDVRCRIDKPGFRGSRQQSGFIKAGSRRIFLPVETDLRLGDRLLVDGIYYSVSDSEVIDGMRDDHHIEGSIEIIDWEYSS
ncbi:MAG: hypothetical protein ACFFD1_01990 [Candidatus Thorarchaeota archaeon]